MTAMTAQMTMGRMIAPKTNAFVSAVYLNSRHATVKIFVMPVDRPDAVDSGVFMIAVLPSSKRAQLVR